LGILINSFHRKYSNITWSSVTICTKYLKGLSLSWLYGSWIYNYLCNQCLSPLTFWVRIPFRRGVLNTTLCDKVCQWLAACRWSNEHYVYMYLSIANENTSHFVLEIWFISFQGLFGKQYDNMRKLKGFCQQPSTIGDVHDVSRGICNSVDLFITLFQIQRHL
jgi:hypothetical protein